MATPTLLSLLDDITAMLDQVAAATKIAAKKTAGVVADDMALNAQQVVGVHPSRELPVVWAVAKGSLLNKLVIIPALLAVSALLPRAVPVLLLVGGVILCFEGFEKIARRWSRPARDESTPTNSDDSQRAKDSTDVVAREREKIKGAIRTDFILSAEIAVIALGAVASRPLGVRVATLAVVGLAMSVGVYGLVAVIVRLDDAGLSLIAREGAGAWTSVQRAIGRGVLRATPWIMRALSVFGTAAMFLVGGGIVAHNLGPAHALVEAGARVTPQAAATVVRATLEGLVGVATGLLSALVFAAVKRARPT
jgi:predicted DNA repair protein MutK